MDAVVRGQWSLASREGRRLHPHVGAVPGSLLYFLDSEAAEDHYLDSVSSDGGAWPIASRWPGGAWGVPHHPFVCSSLPFTRCSTLTSFQFTIRLVGPP